MEQKILSNSEIRSTASQILNAKSYLGLLGLGILCFALQVIASWAIPSAIISTLVSTVVNLLISVFCIKLYLDFVHTGKITSNLGAACQMSYKRFLQYFGVIALMVLIIFAYCLACIIAGAVLIVMGIHSKLFMGFGFLAFIVAWIIAIIISYRYRMAMFIVCENIQRPIKVTLRQDRKSVV